MAKDSSNKKVAKAAKAGGGRARVAGERNVLFPAMLSLVVVLGVALVVYARDDRLASALESPVAGEDHWHSAMGIYACDSFLPDLREFTAPRGGGTHTHGDGLAHIHPFSSGRSGANATLANLLNDAGEVFGTGDALSNDSLTVPGGQTYTEGDTVCEGVEGDPIVQVAVWRKAIDAISGDEPDEIITEGFADIRFENDGEVFVVAFAPEGTEIPAPPSIDSLSEVGSDLGVTPEDIPEDLELDGNFGEIVPVDDDAAEGQDDADPDADADGADADGADADADADADVDPEADAADGEG